MGISGLLSDPVGFAIDLLKTLPAILIALTFHEFGHAFVAYRLGDPTAKMLGRLTLNPVKHIDPLGLFFMAFAGIGWAKPVPINPRHFKHPRRDDLLVSIAGVTMNLILFLLSLTAFYCLFWFGRVSYYHWSLQALLTFSSINAVLCVFNLLPLPPLDGYHVFNDLVLQRPLFTSRQASQAGMAIILVLSYSGLLSEGLGIVVGAMYNAFEALFIQIVTLFM